MRQHSDVGGGDAGRGGFPHGDHASADENSRDELVVDCDRCPVRGDACHDCVVAVLFGLPPEIRPRDDEDGDADADGHLAADAFADAGAGPRLRLVPVEPVGTPPVPGEAPVPDESDSDGSYDATDPGPWDGNGRRAG